MITVLINIKIMTMIPNPPLKYQMSKQIPKPSGIFIGLPLYSACIKYGCMLVNACIHIPHV